MKITGAILGSCLLFSSARAAAVDDTALANFLQDAAALPKPAKGAPALDPKQVINESNSFLKEREPEMTAEEYALYEKIVSILGSNPPFAVKLLEAMMNEKTPPNPAFEFILGNAYYSAGQVAKSEVRYRNAVTRFPTFIRAWNNLGVLYYSAGKYTEAVPCFSKAVVLGDRDPMTFGLLGYSLEQGGDQVSAEMAFMQALGGDPANLEWKEGLLRICIAGKQFARAEALVKDLIAKAPRETRYWLAYANILLADNRKLEAIVLLENAAATGVAGGDELLMLADLYSGQGLVPEAIATYERLRTVSPGQATQKLLEYVDLLIRSGKLDAATKLVESLPPPPEGDLRLGWLQARADLYAAQKRWPAARTELDTLLGLAPLNGRALLALGRAYANEGELERAGLAFESAARVTTSAYSASLELANLELRNRHYAKCVDYLVQALAIQRTDTVEDYLARIRTLVAAGETHSP